MSVSITINAAVYGGCADLCQAFDVTQAVQNIIDSGVTQITFDNDTFGDPAMGVNKGFAVSATIDEVDFFYAGQEGDSVEFAHLPINSDGPGYLKVTNLAANFDVSSSTLFTECSVAIENLAAEDYPNDTYPSAWLWLDFYLVESDDTLQAASAFTQIGELPVSMNYPIGYQERHNFHLSGYEYTDMAKYLIKTRRLVNSGDYYLYVQVRNDDAIINPSLGCFSEETYSYSTS